ncbi:MAG: GNAT family N-acetyltransferase [Desulfatitalea sp.]
MKRITPRIAGVEDIPGLAKHHGKMFAEIWEKKKATLSTAEIEALERAYSDKLTQQMKDSVCVAWVISHNERLAASGAITLVSFVPVPNDLNHRIVYLHSMYTEKEYRGNGCARRIVQAAIDYCRTQGVKRVLLNASDAGRPVYAALGFQAAPEAMRLFIPEKYEEKV